MLSSIRTSSSINSFRYFTTSNIVKSVSSVSTLRKVLKPHDPENPPRVKPSDYATAVKKVQSFFEEDQKLQHCFAMNDMKLLAACEDANNIAVTNLGGKPRAIMQTGQMALEADIMGNREVQSIVDDMLKFGYKTNYLDRLDTLSKRGNIFAIETLELIDNNLMPNQIQLPKGYFAHNVSTRDESRAGDGRREFKFPLTEFEFENKTEESGFDELAEFLSKLIVHLGFPEPKLVNYEDECSKFGVEDIEDKEEQALCDKYGPVVLLGKFPQRSDPFFNMRHAGNGIYDKIDVIVHGFESAGTAVRSCNIEEMKENIKVQDSGEYLKTMYRYFGQDRVDAEIDEYTDYNFIPRCGGGLGMSRIIRGMKIEGLL
jgi:aspartyl/asparaginyl-tRNA synthetase